MHEPRSTAVRDGAAAAEPRAGSWAAWMVAVRPRSLPVAVAPVLVGAAFALARTGSIDLPAALLVLGASLLMQVVTNLQNDVGYTLRGGDRSGSRNGLPRATARGWLGVRQVRAAIVAASVLAALVGLALAVHRGWPVIAIGVVCLLAALAYMGGPWPLAYTPLGELTVFVFFGLVAVSGTDWVLSGGVGADTVLAASAVGAIAAAALAVNNHRDIAHDREVGRRTFAVCTGEAGSRALFDALLGAAFALVPVLGWRMSSAALLLPLLLLPAAWRLRRGFRACSGGSAFNEVLFRTFRLGLWFAIALSTGALLSRWAR